MSDKSEDKPGNPDNKRGEDAIAFMQEPISN